MPPDLPPAWQATLDEILLPRAGHPRAACSPSVRFLGAWQEMEAAGWLVHYEDEAGKVEWTLTPWAAERLGYVLVEMGEDRPAVWVAWDRAAGEWEYPGVDLVVETHRLNRRLTDSMLLSPPDPMAEKRRRNMPRKLNRREKRELRERRKAEAARRAG